MQYEQYLNTENLNRMEELKIQMAFDPKHFRDLYYQNGQGNIFTYAPFKKSLVLLSLIIAFTLIIYLLSLSFPYTAFSVLFVMGLLGIASGIVYASWVMVKFFQWKVPLQRYLTELANYRTHNIVATANYIEVFFDAKSTMEKWENISTVHYESNYIVLFKKDIPIHIFPAQSMQPDEFESLKNFIREKVK